MIVEAPGATNIKANLDNPRRVYTTISLITFEHSILLREHDPDPQSS